MSLDKNDAITSENNQDDNLDLSWKSLNSVQMNFVEMERQRQKIVILAEDASQKIDTLSSSVSSLTTSAESSYEIGGSCVDKIKNINTNISEKMLDQMNKMQELNEETKTALSSMVNNLLYAYVPETDENGNVLYDEDGNIVYKTDAEGDLIRKSVYKFTVDGEEINYNQLLKQSQTNFDEDRYNEFGGGNSLYDGTYSKEEFLKMVSDFGETLGTNTIGNSPVNVKTGYETNMLPYAEVFFDEATSRGLDPAFIFAIGCQESGYGSSYNAVYKGNLFGMGAYDSNPSNAFSYDSVQSAIADVCENIASNYVTPGGQFYTGSDISCIGETYAGDPNWASSVTWIMKKVKNS